MVSDMQMIRALLLLPAGKLSGGDKRAFQAMYDDLVNGKLVRLSVKQRAWVEGAFNRNNLAGKELPPREEGALVKHKEKVVLNFGPIPKPPGRK
jgi:hypothetical protein